MSEPFSSTVTSYDEMIDAFRARKAALGLTDAVLEELSGMTAGYVAKLLGPGRSKAFGPLSFDLMIGGLALKLIVVDDMDAVRRMEARWDKRSRPAPLLANARTLRAVWLFDKRKSHQSARNRWAKVDKKKRSEHALRMNRIRWRKVRKAAREAAQAGAAT